MTNGDLSTAPKDVDLLIVGCGLSGAVIAERCSKELGMKSLILDVRDHIGGNCYDFVEELTDYLYPEMKKYVPRTPPMRPWRQRCPNTAIRPKQTTENARHAIETDRAVQAAGRLRAAGGGAERGAAGADGGAERGAGERDQRAAGAN